MKRVRNYSGFIAGLLVMLAGVALPGQGATGGLQMPDPRQMSGVPLPVGDLAVGTVSVRLIRGSLDKPVAGQTVTISGAPGTPAAATNETGRAQFTGLRPGTRVKAAAIVDGERLESQEFAIPASGGVRLMLVATDPDAAKRAEEDRALAREPAQPGIVVLGEETRFVFELGDDGLTVFNILQIMNTARTPVQPQQPLVFDVPPEGLGAALLEGSSPQAAIGGKRITVTGPFAPGATLVQFAYSLPYSSDSLTVRQALPVNLTQLTVIAQKVGEMHFSSPQMARHREMQADGRTYILGQGPAVGAGDTLTFEFTGLPHAATWPRNVALALAVAILACGVWGSIRKTDSAAAVAQRRRRLEERRDRLFAELVAVEEQHRDGALDGSLYSTRRRALVNALERVYSEIDEEAAA